TVTVELTDSDRPGAAEAAEAATLLLALPWELIHSDHDFLFGQEGAVLVRRGLSGNSPLPALATDPPIRVLLVTPRPEDESNAWVDHRVSVRPLIDALSELEDVVELKVLEPPTFSALEQELARATYHVIHFDGHGVYDRRRRMGSLAFENP